MRCISRHLAWWATVVAGGFAAMAGCGTSDGSGDRATSPNGSGATGSGTKGTSGSSGAASPGDPSAGFCSATGPLVSVPGATATTYDTCTGRIAETRFGNALCTCNDATMAGYLKTRAFDSRTGPAPDTLEGGGSVGINHTYSITTGFTDVGGAFTVAGSESLSFAGFLQVGGDLRLAGEAIVAGYTKIYRNAWLGGAFTDLGPFDVGGDLHTGASVMAIPVRVGGTRAAFSPFGAPCPCEPSQLLDVGALVDDAKLHNDNAAAGIDARMLNLVVGNVDVTLPCGRFFFEHIGGIGNIIVNVTGRAAVFVDESVDATGNLEFRLAPGAAVDLFIRGNLVLTGRAVFGSRERPAGSRIYVGGDGDVLLIGAGGFVGNLYAPRSLVTAVGYAEVWGSIFARDFQCPGYANFVYDSAIQHAGDSCDQPPPPKDSCDHCGTCTGGTACVGETCGACTLDGDCCSPMICSGGKCIEYVPVY